MTRRIRLAIVGFGKIARDQHRPAIAAIPAFELAAIADPATPESGVPCFASLEELLANGPEIDAVALCTPPQVRRAQAAVALAAGKHVLLEKPPGATVSEIGPLLAAASANGRTLFATWHSRFAPGVEPLRKLLAERRLRHVQIEWREDVRVWHPGQRWIWEPGGLGVFDPGINALSILTHILPRPVFLTEASLQFPENCQAPIAASLAFSDGAGLIVGAEFDFLQTGPQTWDIHADTDQGRLTLSGGGARLMQDGEPMVGEREAEYPAIYRYFAGLIEDGRSDVDLAPLVHVADAFLLGRRTIVAPFHE